MVTITHVYDTYAHAQNAVNALESAGFAVDEISVIANRHVSEQYENVEAADGAASGAGLGAAVGGGAGLLAGLGLLAIPGLGPVVAAGWLASTVLGAAAGAVTGGLIGALVGAGVSEDDANTYAEAVRRGGTMVTVRAPDARSDEARAIMARFSPIDPEVRADEYRKTGWTRFDPDAAPYAPSQAKIERMRRPGL